MTTTPPDMPEEVWGLPEGGLGPWPLSINRDSFRLRSSEAILCGGTALIARETAQLKIMFGTENLHLRGRIDDLETYLKIKTDAITQLEASHAREMEKLESRHASEMDGWINSIADLQASLRKVCAERDDLRASCAKETAKLRDRIAELESRLESAMVSGVMSKVRVKELEASHARLLEAANGLRTCLRIAINCIPDNRLTAKFESDMKDYSAAIAAAESQEGKK